MIESRWTPSNAQLVKVLKLQYPELKTGRALIPDLESAFPILYDDMRWFRRVPDAYTIRAAENAVDIFEAEVTHPIPLGVILDITRLWLHLDGMDICLSCYVVNRYGHINILDLHHWYFEVWHGEMANRRRGGREGAEIDAAFPGSDRGQAGISGRAQA